MHDAGKILSGLAVFLLLVTAPVWYNMASGRSDYVPQPKIVTQEKACVAAAATMREEHMDLLNRWRDDVVRRGQRTFVAEDGRSFEMSLTGTCMKCHSNKAEFCDSCHDYMMVSPYCWDCHLEPEGER